jgi:hypothetical protein
MILFGSTSGKDRHSAFFQLNTVFVVAEWIDYSPNDLDSLRAHTEVSEFYYQLGPSKAFPKNLKSGAKLRLYRGATFQDQVEGMYSFSPAQVESPSAYGFPRVRLNNKSFLTNNLNSGPKYTPQKPDPNFLHKVQMAWSDVVAETRRQGCVEAVRFSLSAASQPTAQVTNIP